MSRPRKLRERSRDTATRIFSARSGGACLRPREETSKRVLSIELYSDWHVAHSPICSVTACISPPVTAPSRYRGNNGRASVHLIALLPPLLLDRGFARFLTARCPNPRPTAPRNLLGASSMHPGPESGEISPCPGKPEARLQSLHTRVLRYPSITGSFGKARGPVLAHFPHESESLHGRAFQKGTLLDRSRLRQSRTKLLDRS